MFYTIIDQDMSKGIVLGVESSKYTGKNSENLAVNLICNRPVGLGEAHSFIPFDNGSWYRGTFVRGKIDNGPNRKRYSSV